MTWYELWLFLHITAVIVWFGGAVAAQVFGALASRSGDPARTAAYGRDMAQIGPKLFLPASLVVLATGVLLTEDGNWPWDESFVVFGIFGWAVVAGTAFGYLMQAMGRAGARMAAEGPTPELVGRVRLLVLLGRGLIVLGFVIVLVMVAKPGS
jgi:uncharacterized membrane protein